MCEYCIESVALVAFFGAREADPPLGNLGRVVWLQESPDVRSLLPKRERPQPAPPPVEPQDAFGDDPDAEWEELTEIPAFLRPDPVYQRNMRQLRRARVVVPTEREVVVCRVVQELVQCPGHARPNLLDHRFVRRVLPLCCGTLLREALPHLLPGSLGAALSPLYSPTTYRDEAAWASFGGSPPAIEEACTAALGIYLAWATHHETPGQAAWLRFLEEKGLPALDDGLSFDALFRCFFFAVTYLGVHGREVALLDQVAVGPPVHVSALNLWLQRTAFVATLRRSGPGRLWDSVGKVRSALVYHAAMSIGISPAERRRLSQAILANRCDDYADVFSESLASE